MERYNLDEPPRRRDTQQRAAMVLLVLAAFGPYVVGNIRTEQLVVYLLAVLLLPITFMRLRIGVAWWLIVPWIIFVFVGVLGVLMPLRGPMPWPRGNALAGIDNLMLPLAVLLVVLVIVPRTYADSYLIAFARLVALMAAINGAIAIVSTRAHIDAILRPFWSGSMGTTTAENAATLGRYSGVFNHPAEAGLFYGLAGLLCVFVYAKRPSILTLHLTLIVVGGLLTVSKIFVLGGFPLICLYTWRRFHASRQLLVWPLVGASALTIIASGIFQEWDGLWGLTRLMSPPQDRGLIEFYTAGRWGNDASLSVLVRDVLDVSPVVGVGAAGWSVAYDSGWTEAIIVGGMLAVVCHAAALFAVWRLPFCLPQGEYRELGIICSLLLTVASIGIPSLTANRTATIVWMLLSLFVLLANHYQERSVSAPHRLPYVIDSVAWRHEG